MYNHKPAMRCLACQAVFVQSMWETHVLPQDQAARFLAAREANMQAFRAKLKTLKDTNRDSWNRIGHSSSDTKPDSGARTDAP